MPKYSQAEIEQAYMDCYTHINNPSWETLSRIAIIFLNHIKDYDTALDAVGFLQTLGYDIDGSFENDNMITVFDDNGSIADLKQIDLSVDEFRDYFKNLIDNDAPNWSKHKDKYSGKPVTIKFT